MDCSALFPIPTLHGLRSLASTQQKMGCRLYGSTGYFKLLMEVYGLEVIEG